MRTAIQPMSTEFRAGTQLEELYALVPLVHLCLTLAGPTSFGSADASRLRQGCFPPSPTSLGSGYPQLQQSRCDATASETLHLRYGQQRLVAHVRLGVDGHCGHFSDPFGIRWECFYSIPYFPLKQYGGALKW